MKKTNKNNLILSKAILERTINELFKSGLNIFQIAEVLDISPGEVKSYIKQKINDDGSSPYKANKDLTNAILYDANVPLATEAIIQTEKERFRKYDALEEKSLSLFDRILSYYSKIELGDPRQDAFIAKLAIDGLKSTQDARAELLRKYEVEIKEKQNNRIILEVLEPNSE